MKILLTGSSGFLGNYIKSKMDYDCLDVITIGRNKLNDFKIDLSREIPNLKGHSVSIVIHSAGKAHMVPKTEKEKEDFYSVNVNGTKNLLKGLELLEIKPKSFVFISSVAVYGIISGNLINEECPLAATDPYGESKIIAENAIIEWCYRNNVSCTILRLPLIIGSNPTGNLLLMINAIKRGYFVNLKKGKARKSMVLAENIAEFIIRFSQVGGIYNITDGYHPSFYELSTLIAKKIGKNSPISIPDFIGLFLSKIGDFIGAKFPFNTDQYIKLTCDLTFDDTKARKLVSWVSVPVLNGFNNL